MYTVFIETHFAASHQLHGYNGMCRDLHGHTWKVRVEIESSRTDEVGISFDFKELKALTSTVIERLDHHHINDVPPFDTENPTAENLSRYIYREVGKLLPDIVSMSRVTVWESASYAVSYRE